MDEKRIKLTNEWEMSTKDNMTKLYKNGKEQCSFLGAGKNTEEKVKQGLRLIRLVS